MRCGAVKLKRKRLRGGLRAVLAGVAVLIVVSCAPVPVPTPEVAYGGQVLYFPQVPVADYRWQATGYGRPWQMVGRDAAFHGRGMWSYTWGLSDCLTDVPMLFNGDPEKIEAWARPSLDRCSKTAPMLMVGNEPEWGTQGNQTEKELAELMRAVETWWPGEYVCCGNLISHAGYLDRTLAAYYDAHGEVPKLSGLHVHAYVNEGFPVDDPLDPRWLAQLQAQWASYLAVVKKWGLPERVVVSECCLLGDYPEATYLQVQREVTRWLRSEEETVSVAWFSAAYHGYPDSNMMNPWTGTPTAVGDQWLALRWERHTD